MKVLIAGDFVPQNRCIGFLKQSDCVTPFQDVISILEQVDFSIVNLESPVVEGIQTPIDKTGPNLCCPKETINYLKTIGFNAVTLANNHFYDYGEAGVNSTIQNCKDNGVLTVGGGHNVKEASIPLYVRKDVEVLAIINVCEKEWSIASDKHGGAAPLNIIDTYHTIQEARKKADYVLVIVHGGIELYQLPTPMMQDTYRFFVEAGADCIVNHHQHCLSGYEIYQGKPIVYGVGNFCFDRLRDNNEIWSKGYLTELDFSSYAVKLHIIPYVQFAEYPKVSVQTQINNCEILNTIEELNKIIVERSKLEESFNKFCDGIAESRFQALEPFRNKLVCYMQRHRLFPRLVKREGRKSMLMRVRCSSNRETLTRVLERYFNLD